MGGERLVGSCSGVFVCVSRGGGGSPGGKGDGCCARALSLSLSLSPSVSLARAHSLPVACVVGGRGSGKDER